MSTPGGRQATEPPTDFLKHLADKFQLVGPFKTCSGQSLASRRARSRHRLITPHPLHPALRMDRRTVFRSTGLLR
jgi:hypothetical protein